MNNVVLCRKSIESVLNSAQIYDARIGEYSFQVGLIDIDEIALPISARYERHVLIRKTAFSCNYRDASMIVNFSEMCREKSSEETIFYSGFGSDFVAEVVNVGQSVTTLSVGDQVIADGTYPFKDNGNLLGGVVSNRASQRYEILHESQLRKIPANFDKISACALSISGQTAHSIIRKLRIEDNHKILITASTSNTALALVPILRNRYPNVQIFASTTNLRHKKRLEGLGVDQVIASPLHNPQQLAEAAKKINGFDIVIDFFSDLYLPIVIGFMTFGAQYITCGVYRQSAMIHDQVIGDNSDFYKVIFGAIQNNITIIGNCLGEYQDLSSAIEDTTKGVISMPIDSVFKGGEISEFVDRSFNSRERFGKVVYQY